MIRTFRSSAPEALTCGDDLGEVGDRREVRYDHRKQCKAALANAFVWVIHHDGFEKSIHLRSHSGDLLDGSQIVPLFSQSMHAGGNIEGFCGKRDLWSNISYPPCHVICEISPIKLRLHKDVFHSLEGGTYGDEVFTAPNGSDGFGTGH